MNRVSLLCLFGSVIGAVCAAEEPAPAKPPTKANFFDRLFRDPKGAQPRFLNAPGNPPAPQLWPLFAPGKLPAGTIVNEADALHLAAGDYAGETFYLTGRLVVTASNADRAVLRFVDAKSRVRVMAHYPRGRPAPGEDAQLQIEQRHGLLITKVVRGDDGVVTVWVREITELAPAAK